MKTLISLWGKSTEVYGTAFRLLVTHNDGVDYSHKTKFIENGNASADPYMGLQIGQYKTPI